MPRRMLVTTLGAEVGTLVAPRVQTRPRVDPSTVGVAAALLAPTLVFLLVFTYWPLVVAVLGSFQRFGRTTGTNFPRASWVIECIARLRAQSGNFSRQLMAADQATRHPGPYPSAPIRERR